ncbi:M15 family metallopeptidase [Cellulomonas sp. Marseille-Q8402]
MTPRTRTTTAALALVGVLAATTAGCAGTTPAAGAVPAAPPSEVAAALDAPSAAGTPAGDPGLTGLDPELAARFTAAQEAAAADGVALTLTSGRRSAEEQQALVDEAFDRYGSPEAHRWVLPPDVSAHVQGLAIDVGPTAGSYWLAEHGVDLGLCQTYVNEVWHYEMLPDGAEACPEPHPDSSWAW